MDIEGILQHSLAEGVLQPVTPTLALDTGAAATWVMSGEYSPDSTDSSTDSDGPPGLFEQESSEEEVATEGCSDVELSGAASGWDQPEAAGTGEQGDQGREQSRDESSSSSCDEDQEAAQVTSNAAEQLQSALLQDLSSSISCESEEEVWEDAQHDWDVNSPSQNSSSSDTAGQRSASAADEGSKGLAAGLAALAGGDVSVEGMVDYMEEQQSRKGLRLLCRAMTVAKAILLFCLFLVFGIGMALVGPALHFTVVQPFAVWVAQGVVKLWQAANTSESRHLVYLGVCLGAGGVFTGVGAGRLRRQWLAEQKGLSRERRRAAARWSARSVLLLLLVLVTCALAVNATPDILLGLQALTGSITAWEFSNIHAGCFRSCSQL